MHSFKWRLIAMPLFVVMGITAAGTQAGAAKTSGPPPLPAGAHVTQSGSDGGGTPTGTTSGKGGVVPNLVPADWCSASFEAWDTQDPDTANAMSFGSCGGPIASITTNATLFGDDYQENLADASNYQVNTSWTAATATDYCDGDVGGCYADNPFSDWVGQTFYTRQGWSGSTDTCTTAGDYLYCQSYPGEWDWP